MALEPGCPVGPILRSACAVSDGLPTPSCVTGRPWFGFSRPHRYPRRPQLHGLRVFSFVQILAHLWHLGYSPEDIISNIFRVCKTFQMAEYLKLEFIKVSESRAVPLSPRMWAMLRFCFTHRPGAWKMLSQWQVVLGTGGLFTPVLPGSDLMFLGVAVFMREVCIYLPCK